MSKQILKNKLWIVIVLILVFSLSYSDACAWWGMEYHHPAGYHWYRGHWWLGESIVTGLAIGAVIAALPSHNVVYVAGVPYYYDGTYYYRPCPGGYVVVANPMPIMPPPNVEVMGAAPYPGAVWVPGHWKWNKRFGEYVWVPGHWKKSFR